MAGVELQDMKLGGCCPVTGLCLGADSSWSRDCMGGSGVGISILELKEKTEVLEFTNLFQLVAVYIQGTLTLV